MSDLGGRLAGPGGQGRGAGPGVSLTGSQARDQAGRPLLAGQRPGWQAQLAGLAEAQVAPVR